MSEYEIAIEEDPKVNLVAEIDEVFHINGNKFTSVECTEMMAEFLKRNEEVIKRYIKQVHWREIREDKKKKCYEEGKLF